MDGQTTRKMLGGEGIKTV